MYTPNTPVHVYIHVHARQTLPVLPKDKEVGEKVDCKTWLRKFVLEQQMPLVEGVKERAAELGYSKKELRRAKLELGIKTWHQFDEDGATENWFWYLEE